MMQRNSFLISHAFRNYLWAALISSACMQLTTMVDAVVVGHYIGPDALTAINLAMPLTTFAVALSTLIGLGPAIMAAKAIGSCNTPKVNSIFSSAIFQALILGGLLGIILYALLPQIGEWLCTNENLLPYLMDYIKVYPFTVLCLMTVFTLVSLVEADGHPKLATKAVVVGSLLDIVLDVVLVKYANMGVQGVALALLANNLAVLLFFVCRMRAEGVSYRWLWPRKSILNVTLAGLKEGTPIVINDLLYSLTLFTVNTLLQMYYGENELFYWAIFLQLLFVVLVIVDCAEGAVLSIGSVLEGEKDMFGLHALVHRVWLLVGGVILFIMVVVWIFPSSIYMLFGDSKAMPEEWLWTIRILSLMLLPYSLTTFMRSLFQVLGYRLWGVFFSLGQYLLIATCLYVSARWAEKAIWWSFSIASYTLLIIQMLFILKVRKMKNISAFSIIPVEVKKNVLELSVAYKQDAVVDAIQHVSSFLQKQNVSTLIEMEINICCEELMMNIVRFQTYKNSSYMDLSVALQEDKISVVLKDSGRPFNPVLATQNSTTIGNNDTPIGLFLVNRVCSKLNHKYMYGLNVVFAEFVFQETPNQ